MTAAQIAANRKSAGNLVRYQLGLDTIPTVDWTYDQRTAFNKALASYISDHPSAFGEQDILTAQIVQTNEYSSLEFAPSFPVSDFVSTLATDVIAPFQAVGNGIITTVTAAKWVIPTVAAVAVVMLLIALNKKVNA